MKNGLLIAAISECLTSGWLGRLANKLLKLEARYSAGHFSCQIGCLICRTSPQISGTHCLRQHLLLGLSSMLALKEL
eukprot:1077732-Pelagomonas_calceolata.AAC.1